MFYFYGDRYPKEVEGEKWEMGPRRGMNQVGGYLSGFSSLVKLLSNKLTDVSFLHLSKDCMNYCFFGEFLLGEEEEFILWFPKIIVKGSARGQGCGSQVGPQDPTPEWHVRGLGQGLEAEAAWMGPGEAGVGSRHGGRSRANSQGSDEAKKI